MARRAKLLYRSLKEFLWLFLSTSSFHGLVHISEKGRHPLERLLWAVAVGLACVGSAWLSLSTWNRFQSSPTVISLEMQRREWMVTLPAVSFCPEEKYDPLKLRAALQRRLEEGQDMEETYELLCSIAKWSFPKLNRLSHSRVRLDPNLYLPLLLEGKFGFTMVKAEDPLTPIARASVTELGICYTYNSQISVYTEPEYWAAGKWTLEKKKKIISSGPLKEETIHINQINSDYKVYIHSPEEALDASNNFIGNGTLSSLTGMFIKVLEIYSTPATRGLSVSQRKCRFMEESNLETSPVYSYNLCRAECRMRLTNTLCGCVPYFYRNTGAYKICDPGGMNCLHQYRERLRYLRNGTVKEDCSCYPTCDVLAIQSLQGRSYQWTQGTLFRMHFENFPKMRLKRDIVFSFWDLLSQMGGAAGLCFGGSIMSFIEILYICTLRAFFFFKNKRMNKKTPKLRNKERNHFTIVQR